MNDQQPPNFHDPHCAKCVEMMAELEKTATGIRKSKTAGDHLESARLRREARAMTVSLKAHQAEAQSLLLAKCP